MTPFEDNFDDGDAVGWGFFFGTWSAANLYLEKTSTGDTGYIGHSQTDGDTELTFSYYFEDTAISTAWLRVHPRYDNWDNQISIQIRPGDMNIVQRKVAVETTLDSTTSATTAQDTWYDVRVVTDGANVTVWRKQRDTNELYVEVLSTTAATVTTSTYLTYIMGPGAPKRVDNVRMLTDVLSNSTTYVYNLANELTSMTDYNGATTFTYDDFGRTTNMALGTDSAAISYRYGAKMYQVDSTLPGRIGAITYDYGADGKRRSRSVDVGPINIEYTWYNWDIGYNVINEEDEGAGVGNGVLDMTYVVTPGNPQGVGSILAHVEGTSPASGSYQYYTQDNLGSTRGLFDQAKATLANLEYTPYGNDYSEIGKPIAHKFTGKEMDPITKQYYSAYRYYAPDTARWLTRDPEGMIDGPNVYAYVTGNPVNLFDPLGLGLYGPLPPPRRNACTGSNQKDCAYCCSRIYNALSLGGKLKSIFKVNKCKDSCACATFKVNGYWGARFWSKPLPCASGIGCGTLPNGDKNSSTTIIVFTVMLLLLGRRRNPRHRAAATR